MASLQLTTMQQLLDTISSTLSPSVLLSAVETRRTMHVNTPSASLVTVIGKYNVIVYRLF